MPNKPKAMLVDNAKLMHGVVKARLASDGIDMHSAFGGEEGIALAKVVMPDVILLDVDMPAPNGFEVCRRLKDDPLLSNIPVIFLTGVSTTEEKVRGLNLGAIDYITKPFDAAELQARVRASLRNKELLDLLSKKAMIDGLTGLYNRNHLNARLEEEIAFSNRHGSPFSCVMMDVDHFKLINDTHGHGLGDTVLKQVADILQQVCRCEDVACRYGGEEFSILARQTTGEAGIQLAERLRAGINATRFTRGAISISVTCSFGVAEFHEGVTDIVDRADKAMYLSKRAGRDRVTMYEPPVTKAA